MVMIKVTYIDHMGSDLSVVNAARVSFGKVSDGERIEFDLLHHDPEVIKASVAKYKADGWVVTSDLDDWKIIVQRPTGRDSKLISYLANHKHISPFGHAFASFHVKAPIFVARQLVKHKFLRWNEISRRYVDDEPEFYQPDVWRGRSADKKQGSEGVVEFPSYYVDRVMQTTISSYNILLARGVAPEQARMVLPQSTMTEWYWSGSLDAFASMCQLRCKPDTQYESRLVADQISEKMVELFPVSWEALMSHS
jgi:thymidylate synthase (FAD)